MTVELVVLAVAGLAAGYVNAIAGAGSLLTLPALIFTGLDSSAANATNRIAVLFQNAAAIGAYRRGGVRVGRYVWPLLLPTVASAAAGAWVATLLTNDQLDAVIAVAMLVFLVLSFVRRRKRTDGAETDESPAPPALPPFRWTMVLGFTVIGFYAGFLQAGVGILILLYLSLLHGSNLVAANALKVVVILLFAIIAIVVFVASGEEIDPLRGVVLAAGTTAGGYLGARATLERGEGFVRIVVVIAVLASVAKLLWDLLRS